MRPSISAIMPELEFTTARSSGPGGQNVNKVNSKVVLRWNIDTSAVLTDEQRAVVKHKLASRVTTEGILVMQVQESRSQLKNKEAVVAKLDELLARAFAPRKARKKTKPTKASKARRVEGKRKHSEKKQWRKKL